MDEAALARAAEQRKSALIAAPTFFEEWSHLARTVIKRSDRLIRPGLAKRISRAEPEVVGPLVSPPPKPKNRRKKR